MTTITWLFILANLLLVLIYGTLRTIAKGLYVLNNNDTHRVNAIIKAIEGTMI